MTTITHGRNAWRDQGKPRTYRTDRTCQAKQRYTDEIAVRAAGSVSMVERKNRHRLWCYRCTHCSGWHLTHSDQGARWEIRANDPAPKAGATR